MRRSYSLALVALSVAACTAYAQQRGVEPIRLPDLDGNSAKGLEIECCPAQTRFAVGEPINVWCTVKNTTDSTKPIGWHPSAGAHFCLAQGDKPTFGGLLPLVIPQLDQSIMMESQKSRPGCILFIPAHESIRILLTHKEDRPAKFKGRVVYDPLDPRDGYVVMNGKEDDGPPWKDQWAASNVFEYEVVAAGAK